MLYRRKTYKINPENLDVFNDFFHNYLLPNQLKHGAKLIGRWVTETKDEIQAVWEYQDIDHYNEIENKVRQDILNEQAKQRKSEIGELFIESKQDFMHSTGQYQIPRHIVAVSGYITNQRGEVLLVRNDHRSDTWEMPGGQVEEHEPLDDAVRREVFEETGANIKITGVKGIYNNITKGIISITFSGEYTDGELRCQEGETIEVRFFKVDEENIDKYITRKHFKNRFLDAIKSNNIPLETFKVRPYELISRGFSLE